MEIEVGDRVTYKSFGNTKIAIMINNDFLTMHNIEILKVERIGSNGWYTVYEKEEKKELLTEEERKYLSYLVSALVLKPEILHKSNGFLYLKRKGGKTGACIVINDIKFKFDNLKEYKEYTLLELGLLEG